MREGDGVKQMKVKWIQDETVPGAGVKSTYEIVEGEWPINHPYYNRVSDSEIGLASIFAKMRGVPKIRVNDPGPPVTHVQVCVPDSTFAAEDELRECVIWSVEWSEGENRFSQNVWECIYNRHMNTVPDDWGPEDILKELGADVLTPVS